MTTLDPHVTYLERHQPEVVLGMLVLCTQIEDDEPRGPSPEELYQITL